MRYNQYIKLKEALGEDEPKTNDRERAPKALNESFLVWLGLAAFVVIFRKKLWRWGVKKAYIQYLTFQNNNFKKGLKEQMSKFINKSKAYIDKIDNIIKEYKDLESFEAKKTLNLLVQRKTKQEAAILQNVNDFITRAYNHKRKEIYQFIEETKLPESHKISLKFYWDVLVADTRAEISNELVKAEILQNENILKKLKQEAEYFKREAKTKIEDLEDLFDEEGIKDIEEEKDKGKSKFTPSRFLKYIEDLSYRKDKMSDIEFENLLAKYVELAMSVDDEHTRGIFIKKFKIEFGEDKISEIMDELDIEDIDVDQDILKDDDDL